MNKKRWLDFLAWMIVGVVVLAIGLTFYFCFGVWGIFALIAGGSVTLGLIFVDWACGRLF